MTLKLRLLQTSKRFDTPVWGHASLVDEDGVGVVSCNYFISAGEYPIESLEMETNGHLDKVIIEAMYLLRKRGEPGLRSTAPYCVARSIFDEITSRIKNQVPE
jgi:hypothetical protein